MQVQKINSQTQNNTNFQGKIFVEPDLSYKPCKFVRRHFETMKSMISNKPYDLFITQDHVNGTVKLIAQNEKDLGKRKALRHIVLVDKNVEDYDIAAAEVINGFDEKLSNLPPTLKEKTKNFFAKLAEKFMKIMQDE